MTKRWKRWLTAGCVLLGSAALVACGGGGDASVAPATPQLGTISGQALASADSSPVSGAVVTAGGVTATTGADGRFSLPAVPAAARVVVRFEAPAFAETFTTLPVVANVTTHTTARLVRAGATSTVTPTANSTVTVSGSTAAVELSANSLVNAATGAAATGPVTVRITPIDPAFDPQSMPGDYTTDRGDRIESFGAVQVTLRDSAGNRLNLRSGSTATVRIPVASRSANPPASIPLFYLNEATGRWVEEGSATLTGAAPDQYYQGTVSHFSFWNADRVQETIFVNGCVNDAAGQPVANTVVESAGIDYSGYARWVTDTSGRFRVPMRVSSLASIQAESGGRYSNAVIAGPSNVDITLPVCLVISTTPQPPTILRQPSSVSTTVGSNVAFSVTGSGAGPLTYQWQRNGVAIPRATSNFYRLRTTAADQGASYTVVVTNSAGAVTSSPAVLTIAAPVPASIVTPPASVEVQAGQTAAFSVQAGGTPVLTYQWQRNGVNIPGANAATYVTPATQLSDNGALYRVVVGSVHGASVTSAAATLSVRSAPVAVAPSITTQPAGVSVVAGQAATFSVVARGSPVLTYQWRRNGVDIAGAVGASYTTPPSVQADNGALFSVRVSNAQGAVTSGSATLTVTANNAEDQQRLLRLVSLTFNFFNAGYAPMALVDEEGRIVNAAGVCQSGSVSGTLNGATLVSGQPLPASGTLAATFSNCAASDLGSTFNGSSSVAYSLTSMEPLNASALMNVTNMRTRTFVGSDAIIDVTANGSSGVTIASSVSGADTTSTVTLTTNNGATLRNELTGQLTTFNAGNVALTTVSRADASAPSGERLVSIRFAYNDLRFAVAGVNYIATGSYQFSYSNTGALVAGSGEVIVTGNGVRVGRIFATNTGLFIEASGVVQAL